MTDPTTTNNNEGIVAKAAAVDKPDNDNDDDSEDGDDEGGEAPTLVDMKQEDESAAKLKQELEDESPKSFPQVLMDILNDENIQDTVSWLPHGRSFIIYKKKKFASKVLPNFFKATKFTSFTRKLNRWGFTRVTRGPEMGSYYHKLFVRDEPALCLRMSSHSTSKFQDGHHHLMPAPMVMPFGMPMPFMPGIISAQGADMAQQSQFINQQLQQLQWQQFQWQQFQQQQQQQHQAVQQQQGGHPLPPQMQHPHMMHTAQPPHMQPPQQQHHVVTQSHHPPPQGPPIQAAPVHHHLPNGPPPSHSIPNVGGPPPGGPPQGEGQQHHTSTGDISTSTNKGSAV